ncbi:hypothetical protein K504DRAFT_460708 [Pleomassaria siparia CBS 279.74]|uniref:Fork-head domain-containing protein n=1 Tax=Pleomassaria siparia CBS 279.74 TaxID=1314801 RepID=A0A6G1JXH8_9PLEO|nr:hypothetical protein K504DRAFT_460708 [Pleomassaria siparia CBS 279.74]
MVAKSMIFLPSSLSTTEYIVRLAKTTFPGLQCNFRRPELPYNRFELELSEPNTPLNVEFHRIFRKESNNLSTPAPKFDFGQMIALALLYTHSRTQTVREIENWVIDNFPYFQHLEAKEMENGKRDKEERVCAAIRRGIALHCAKAERAYEHDLLPKGVKRYNLPYGAEDRLFSSWFDRSNRYGHFGMAPPAPSRPSRVSLLDLPWKAKFKILSEVLTFLNPVSVASDVSGLVVLVHTPSRFSKQGIVKKICKNAISVRQVCKEFNGLGKLVFYTTNTFHLHTPDDHHSFVPKQFLGSIGLQNRKLIRSLDFNIPTGKILFPPSHVGEAFKLLKDSPLLTYLTLHIPDPSFSILPHKIRGVPELLDLENVKHVTIFENALTQKFVDVFLGRKMKPKHKAVEMSLVSSALTRPMQPDYSIRTAPNDRKLSYKGADPCLINAGDSRPITYDSDRLWESERRAQLGAKILHVRDYLAAQKAGFLLPSPYQCQPVRAKRGMSEEGAADDWSVKKTRTNRHGDYISKPTSPTLGS